MKKQDQLLTDCQAAQAEVRGTETLASENRDLLVRLQKRQKQLGSNLLAHLVPAARIGLPSIEEDPDTYWATRARLPWN